MYLGLGRVLCGFMDIRIALERGVRMRLGLSRIREVEIWGWMSRGLSRILLLLCDCGLLGISELGWVNEGYLFCLKFS